MNQSQALASQAIPKSLRYSEVVPKGVQATPSFAPFLPSNGSSFTAGQVCRIPIQAYSQFLDTKHSYLSFDVTTTAGAVAIGAGNAIHDAGGHGMIQRLRVLSANNQELERIDDYAHITMLLSDMVRSFGNQNSYGAINEGLRSQGTATTFRKYIGINANTSLTTSFALPLHLSGCLGLLLSKFLPLPIINNGLVLELTFAPINYAYAGADVANIASYSVSNIQYNACLIQPESAFLDTFKNIVAQSGLVLSTTSFRNYVQTLNNTNGTNTLKIVDSLKSVKSFFGTLRRTAILNDGAQFSISNRGREQLSSYFLRLNNVPLPVTPVLCGGSLDNTNQQQAGGLVPVQCLSELMKAVSRFGDASIGGQLQPVNFIADDSSVIPNGNNYNPAFAIGLDLEAYQGQAVLSGTSMFSNNSSEIQVILNGSGNNAVTVSMFLHYDMELKIDQTGVVTVNY